MRALRPAAQPRTEGAWPAWAVPRAQIRRGRKKKLGPVERGGAADGHAPTPAAVVAPQSSGPASCAGAASTAGSPLVSARCLGRGVGEVWAPSLGVPGLRGPTPFGRLGGPGPLARGWAQRQSR